MKPIAVLDAVLWSPGGRSKIAEAGCYFQDVRHGNQEPGIGPDQGPRQRAPNTGEAESGVVRNAKAVKYGAAFSKVSSVMRVTIKPAQVPAAN
jgi:hypothetical protein